MLLVCPTMGEDRCISALKAIFSPQEILCETQGLSRKLSCLYNHFGICGASGHIPSRVEEGGDPFPFCPTVATNTRPCSLRVTKPVNVHGSK